MLCTSSLVSLCSPVSSPLSRYCSSSQSFSPLSPVSTSAGTPALKKTRGKGVTTSLVKPSTKKRGRVESSSIEKTAKTSGLSSLPPQADQLLQLRYCDKKCFISDQMSNITSTDSIPYVGNILEAEMIFTMVMTLKGRRKAWRLCWGIVQTVWEVDSRAEGGWCAVG